MEDKTITFELTLAETNKILTYLGKQKYSQVAGLVVKLQNQIIPQINSTLPQAPVDSKNV